MHILCGCMAGGGGAQVSVLGRKLRGGTRLWLSQRQLQRWLLGQSQGLGSQASGAPALALRSSQHTFPCLPGPHLLRFICARVCIPWGFLILSDSK